ncbi:hypothetical protein [Micromonospora sp. IBSANI012]|uniref:hypothetical protein n=1 Tax=Micromonospora sp. IBSANI012 TaxID=3457761 RepID=UPI00405A02A2
MIATAPAGQVHCGPPQPRWERDFLAGRVPDIARARAVQAAGEARRAYAEGLGFSGTIVVSQLGIVVSETLQASGLDMAEANRQAGIAPGI